MTAAQTGTDRTPDDSDGLMPDGLSCREWSLGDEDLRRRGDALESTHHILGEVDAMREQVSENS